MLLPTATAASLFGVPLAFILTAIAIELTPGPNMAYLAVLSLSQGRRAGFAAVVGIALGLFIVGMLAALGLATLIQQSPLAYQALRWGRVAYMLFLAWQTWVAPQRDIIDATTPDDSHYLRQGVLTNLLNPKAAIFYIAVLPPFLDPAQPPLPQTIALTIAYVTIATAIHIAIVSAAAQARPLIAKAGHTQVIRTALALSLVVIATWLAITTRNIAPMM